MPFGIVGQTGPGMRQVVGFGAVLFKLTITITKMPNNEKVCYLLTITITTTRKSLITITITKRESL